MEHNPAERDLGVVVHGRVNSVPCRDQEMVELILWEDSVAQKKQETLLAKANAVFPNVPHTINKRKTHFFYVLFK